MTAIFPKKFTTMTPHRNLINLYYILANYHEESDTNGYLKKINMQTSLIVLGDSCVKFSTKVRKPGAILDNKMKFTSHVNTVCQKAHNQLPNIGQILKYSSQETKKIIVHAFVTTRLDYLNSLLCGMPEYIIK